MLDMKIPSSYLIYINNYLYSKCVKSLGLPVYNLIISLNKYLLNIYYMAGSVLNIGEKTAKNIQIHILKELIL